MLFGNYRYGDLGKVPDSDVTRSIPHDPLTTLVRFEVEPQKVKAPL